MVDGPMLEQAVSATHKVIPKKRLKKGLPESLNMSAVLLIDT
jgi:hypothetical protein